MKKILNLKGLDCANCAAKIENRVRKLDGVENVSVSFMTQKLVVETSREDEEILNKIKKVIRKEEPDVKVEEI